MTTIIGNRLNSANKKVLDRMNKMDFEFIRRETRCQIEYGADFIELNAISLLHNEIPFLKAAIPILEGIGAKVMVISENADALREALLVSKKETIIGAVEFDLEKINYLLDPIKKRKAKMIALIKEKGHNSYYSPEKSLLIAQQYVDYLLDNGIRREDILLDPMVRPLEESFSNGKIFLNTLELFKLDFPQVKTLANVSSLSEGLPKKQIIVSYFVSLALCRGLDYIVANVLDENVLESIITTLSIIGKDKNLHSYLRYCRNHKECKQKGIKDGGSKNKRNSD